MPRKESEPLVKLLRNLAKLAALPLEKATAMEPGVYTSQEFLELERQRIFKQQWLCAGLAADISEPGNYTCFEIDLQPIVIIRQLDGSIQAFSNICRHRMMTLLEGGGSCRRIVCPYHAWTYGIDGQLIAAPHMQDRPGFDKSSICLPEIRCEIWHGWMYVTLDQSVEPVSQLLAGMEPLVSPYKMENYVPIDRQDHVWSTNWKQLTENFMEGYHLPVTHKNTVGGYFPVEDTQFSKESPDPAFTYQFFTKTGDAPVGTAHPDNKHLKGKQRRTSILPTVFPSHMYALAPDHFWYLSLQPRSTGEVAIRYGAALAPEVLAASKNPEELIAKTRSFLDRVNEEDRMVTEGIFRGAQAPLSISGPLCWLERENHEFTQYLARQLCTKS
ncbi:MAG: aromatic ring-hydroxylating oxygenase subunit alpha [bacterium]